MKQPILLAVLPWFLVASPALAQTPAAPATPALAQASEAPAAQPEPVEPPLPSVAATPPAAAATPTPPASEEKPPAEAPPLSDRLEVGKTGFFQPSATLQLWLFGAQHDDDWTSTFRVRRAELRVKGEIVPKTLGYFVMIDPARALEFEKTTLDVAGQDPEPTEAGSVTALQPPKGSSSSILQDVGVTFLSEYADVSLGQFKNPVSLEGAGSSSKLLFPERSLVSRKFGDKRDIGVKLEKKFEYFGYTLGAFNGEGHNKLDSNDQKDLALRLEAYPVKGVTVAAVGYTAVADRDLPGTKDRVEADLKLEKYDALLQAEYIRGWDRGATERVVGQGFYVAAGYTLFDKLQPILRIGWLDPEVGEDEGVAVALDPNDEVTQYELGVNYYVKSHDAKLQLAGGWFDAEQKDTKPRYEMTLAAQISF